jgi:SNF2 family DNA or RNA helicase
MDIEAEFDLVVLDECHRSRANAGKTAKFCDKLGRTVPYRLGLTGTPLPRSPLDAYAQYRFLDPGIFGISFGRFCAEYSLMGEIQGHQVLQYRNLDDLAAKMYSIGFRVMSKDVFDLPPFQDITREFDLDPNDRTMYQEMENDFCVQIKDILVTADNALVKILRLQELTSGFLEGMPVNIGKKKLLEDVLEDFEKKEPIVIFARFTNDLKNIKEVAESQGRTYAELSGHAHELPKWQAGGADVLGVQIKSGREGVDFTRARYCIYYSLGHSLGDYNQSRKRLDRPGQTREGVYIHLIAKRTIDSAVMAALEKKEEIVESVLRQYRERKHDGSSSGNTNAGPLRGSNSNANAGSLRGVTGSPDRVGGPVSQAEIGPRQREGLSGQPEGGLQGRL